MLSHLFHVNFLHYNFYLPNALAALDRLWFVSFFHIILGTCQRRIFPAFVSCWHGCFLTGCIADLYVVTNLIWNWRFVVCCRPTQLGSISCTGFSLPLSLPLSLSLFLLYLLLHFLLSLDFFLTHHFSFLHCTFCIHVYVYLVCLFVMCYSVLCCCIVPWYE